MDSQIDISGISIIDILLFLLFAWAAYKGYKRGPVVHAVSLLIVLAGITIFAALSKEVTDFIRLNSNMTAKNLELYMFGILFIAVVWLSNFVADKTAQVSTASLKKPINIILGILTSGIKYLYFASIILLFLNQTSVLSPQTERKSHLYKFVKTTALETIKPLDILK